MRSTNILILFLLLPIIVAVCYAAGLKDRPTAVSNGSDIFLRWNTNDENGIQRFEVVRRAGTIGDFMLIGSVSPRGSNSSYEFTDTQAFKSISGLYQYRVRLVLSNGPAVESEVVSVTHLTSAAKRTWGSIKAMFR